MTDHARRVGDPVPHYQTPPPPRPYARRILLVTGHFPPSRAVGGLRWQKMAWYAAERGWGVDVVSFDPRSMPDQDPERLVDLPPGIRLFGAEHEGLVAEPLMSRLRHVVKSARRARARMAARSRGAGAAEPVEPAAPPGSVPRGEVGAFRPWAFADVFRAVTTMRYVGGELRWARRLEALARSIVGPAHKVLVSSGPPHFAHEAARRVALATGLPHVVDFRDPWSVSERIPLGIASPLYLSLVERYERSIMEHAALVVANTELAARAMRGVYPALAERIVTVMNGSDDEAPRQVARDPRFLVAYTGAIYFDRDPRLLFRAGARVIRELGLAPSQFGFELMGPVDVMSPPVWLVAMVYGGVALVRNHPAGPGSAAGRLLASASLLVSLPQDTETAIPSKIFEYSTYDAWVLALARQGSASALVLEGSGADVVAPDDAEGIAGVLRQRYQEFASGVRPRAVGGDGRFSRARQAAIMLDHLDRVAAR